MSVFSGSSGPESLRGGPSDDTLYGLDGHDTLLGEAGDDLIVTEGGDDSADGGLGNDRINGIPGPGGSYSFYASSGAQTLLGGAGDDFIVGGEDADTLEGGDDADTLIGFPGADLVRGGTGNDSLSGDQGADTLEGGSGHDTLMGGLGDDSLDGGEGDDQLFDQGQGSGRDTLQGGDGNDWLSTYLSDDGDVLHGGSGQDTLDGGSGADELNGGADQDRLLAGDGNDSLSGDAGNDTLWGGSGDDLLQGGDGNDELWDQGFGAGVDTLRGGNGNDRLITYTSNDGDLLDGGAGNDALDGGSGDDHLIGGSDDDTLAGHEGRDTLDGGAGMDLLFGGEGDDLYLIVDRRDRVVDVSGFDRAEVAVSFAKLPSSIESVTWVGSAQALPYWIDALLPDDASGDWYDALLGDPRVWKVAFPSSIPDYNDNPADAAGFQALNPAQQDVVWQALAVVEAFTPLRFVPTGDAAQPNTLAFAYNHQTASAGYSYYPSEDFIGSDVFLDVDSVGNRDFPDNSYARLTLVHEIGHALGLKHPFAHSDAAGHVEAGPVLPEHEDNTAWTVMSYTDSQAQYQLAYSPLDVAALQYLYGLDPDDRAGNDRYALRGDGPNFIWDGAGIDAIDASGLDAGVTIFLEPGHRGYVGTGPSPLITSAGQIIVNFGTVIEEVVGSPADDRVIGNTSPNRFDGGDGADTLVGASGNDTLRGGRGDDILLGGEGIDSVVMDRVRADLLIQPPGEGDHSGWIVRLRGDAALGAVNDQGLDRWVDIEQLQLPGGATLELYAVPRSASVVVFAAGSGRVMSGVRIELDGVERVTDAVGVVAFDNLATADAPLRAAPEGASPAALSAVGAIGLSDVIGILRMAVGGDTPNADTSQDSRMESLLRHVAADVDADGHVSLRDSLAALRLLSDPSQAQGSWAFVSDQVLHDAATDAAVTSLPTLPTVSADSSRPFQAGLIGLLRGDLDGTWSQRLLSGSIDSVHVDDATFSSHLHGWPWGSFGVDVG